MKNLPKALVVGVATLASSVAFAGSVGPGNSQGGQAIALSNLNAAIVSGTISGFYAGGSSSPGFSGGGAPGGFISSFAPSAPSGGGPASLLLPPSDPALLRTGVGGGSTSSTTSNSSNSNSNSSNSNSSGSNSSGNSSNNNSNSNGGGSGAPATGGFTLSALTAPLTQDTPVASVPDNGAAMGLLGAALAGLALLRRKFRF